MDHEGDTPTEPDGKAPMEDTTAESTVDTQPVARRSRPFRMSLPFALLALLVVLLIAGTAVAFALPVVSVTPEKPIAQMLPAGTAFYLSADLNPSGDTKTNLDAIEHAFTDQPSWKNIANTFNGTMHSSQQSNACYHQTQGQVQAHLGDLGHSSAFALIGTGGVNMAAGTQSQTALEHNAVFLASLDVHMTLVQALGGFHLTLQQTSTDYHGTTIYQESFPACGKVNPSMPQTIYAAVFKGYVVLGLIPDPVERVIDTGSGSAPSLTSLPSYQTLMAQLPSNQLGGYYFSGSALKGLGLLKALRLAPNAGSVPGSYYQNVQKPTAGALGVEPDGFRLTAAAYSPSGSRKSQAPAGQLAAQLPSDTLALLSVQNVAAIARNVESQLKKAHLLTGSTATSFNAMTNNITGDLSGEADAVLLHPTGAMNFHGTNGKFVVPLSLLWQVKDDAVATQHLNDLAMQLKVSSQLTPATASDGTPYFVTKDGYGYAVRKGWAIVSLAILQQISALSPAQNLASNPAYLKTTLNGLTPGLLWYFDLHNLRLQLEASLLPSVVSSATQYNQYAKPILTPLQSLSGSAGTSRDGQLGLTTLFLGISKNTGS